MWCHHTVEESIITTIPLGPENYHTHGSDFIIGSSQGRCLKGHLVHCFTDIAKPEGEDAPKIARQLTADNEAESGAFNFQKTAISTLN